MRIGFNIRFFSLILLLGSYSFVIAQEGHIEGELKTFGFYFLKWGNAGENNVILQNTTGFFRKTTSNEQGKFIFTDVPIGHYFISVDCKAELRDLGLCNMTGSTNIKVKINKTTKIKIVVKKL